QDSFEIALVLDNTGSMASASSSGVSKLSALKTAATNFVNTIYNDATMGPRTKMSLVPFSAAVAVTPGTYRNAWWIDQSARSSLHWQNVSNPAGSGFTSRFDILTALKAKYANWDWAGCFESLPYPLNVQDGAPTPSNLDSYFVPMLAVDESGNGGQTSHTGPNSTTVVAVNSYITDSNSLSGCGSTTVELDRTGRACKYQSPQGATQTNYSGVVTGPNMFCSSRPLTRLTSDRTTLLSEISAMQAAGNTDIHEGVAWGWRTLSPLSVFGDGVPYTTQGAKKILIVMTDGANTWTANPNNPTLKSYYSAYGYYQNVDGTTPSGRLPSNVAAPTSDATARAAMDALTLETCRNAAQAGITIYTIGFSVSSDPMDQTAINLLRSCAGSADRAYLASDTAAISSVFAAIAKNLSVLRLSQ
ncbi:MAG: hypothetical protein JO048_01910, partial [Methylobacteriaceae bacterium]|nr:hypothetical protein [Methylobacteriaceae bacterium]